MDNELKIKLVQWGFFIAVALFSVFWGWFTHKMIKKNPKLYVPFNLIIYIYPYIYMILIAVALMIENGEVVFSGFIIAVIIHPVILATLIADGIINAHKMVPAKNLATINMVIKLVHIPAFILHFIIGIFSSLLSVWGLGFLIAVVVIDLFTIIISGTQSVMAIISLCKQKTIPKWMAITCAIFSYIYCIDVAIAIFLNAKVRSELKKAS